MSFVIQKAQTYEKGGGVNTQSKKTSMTKMVSTPSLISTPSKSEQETSSGVNAATPRPKNETTSRYVNPPTATRYASSNNLSSSPQKKVVKVVSKPPNNSIKANSSPASSGGPSSFYTVEHLKTKPMGVDLANVDTLLSPSDFEKVFGMSKEKWQNIPAWQKTAKRKEAGLF